MSLSACSCPLTHPVKSVASNVDAEVVPMSSNLIQVSSESKHKRLREELKKSLGEVKHLHVQIPSTATLKKLRIGFSTHLMKKVLSVQKLRFKCILGKLQTGKPIIVC